MKSIRNYLLAFTGVALLLLHWRLGPPAPATEPASAQAVSAPDVAPSGAERPLAEPESAVATQLQTDPGSITNSAAPNMKQPAFNWASIEVSDYKEYVKRLKAIGFPQELIRDIVIADLDKLYEPSEQALKPKPVPYDAPPAQRQNLAVNDDDWRRILQLREVRVQKQTALATALGEYVPREILRTPIARNYEAYEYAFSQLPPEKREYVQCAQENEFYTVGYNTTTMQDHAAELEAFKQIHQQRDQDLLKVLTPEEFDRYHMCTTPAGTELARRTIGMQPTDEEFQAMFRITYKNWLDTGGVYGRWRAVRVPSEQIAAADKEMNESLKQALGPGRFLEYEMAISTTGQQMRNFATRFDLPGQTMAQAFQLQTQIDQLSHSRMRVVNSDGSSTFAPHPALSEAQAQLQQLLGPELCRNWEVGRNLRVNLDP